MLSMHRNLFSLKKKKKRHTDFLSPPLHLLAGHSALSALSLPPPLAFLTLSRSQLEQPLLRTVSPITHALQQCLPPSLSIPPQHHRYHPLVYFLQKTFSLKESYLFTCLLSLPLSPAVPGAQKLSFSIWGNGELKRPLENPAL